MGWFTRSQKEKAQPGQVGVFLCAYIHQTLMTTAPSNSLRDLLSTEGVPAEKRETFDNSLFLLALYVAFVAARRKYPIHVADTILSGALDPILSKCSNSERQAVRDRLDRYGRLCQAGATRGSEL